MSVPTLITLPAWNEAPNLPAVVSELRRIRPHDDVLVVDDGSSDDTAQVARSLKCPVLQLPLHLGYGAAIQAGIKYGRSYGYGAVVTFDADGQHDPADIAALLDALENGADLAIGSRPAAAGSYRGNRVRQAGRYVFAALVRGLTSFRLSDPTSGLKALGPRAQALFAQARFPDRFPDADALVLAQRSRLVVVERPAHMRPSLNRHSMHDGHATAYTCNMLFSLFVAALSRETDLRR